MNPSAFSKYRQTVLFVTIFLFIIILLGVVFFWSDRAYLLGKIGFGSKITARVADETISRETVENLAKKCSIDQKLVLELLIDEKALGAWADFEKIVISKEEQEGKELQLGGTEGLKDSCTKLEAKVTLLREKLSQTRKKFREGKLIVINFDKYYPFFEGNSGNSEKLLEDKTYAEKLAKEISNKIKTNKLSFEQAIEEVRNDPKVGSKSPYATSPQSGSFTATDYLERIGLLNSSDVRKKIDQVSVGQVSEPFINQANLSANPEETKLVDARYLIVKVERVGEGFSGSVEQLLEQTRKEYGAKIY